MAKEKYAFGVDLGGTKIEILKVNTKGKVLDGKKIPTDAKKGPAHVIKTIADVIKSLTEKANPPLGVGVGVAGQVDAARGTLHFAPNLKWKNVALGSLLKKALKTKVFVTNDVRSAMLGEWTFGALKGAKNLLCIFVGTGIGGAAVIDGKILTGPNYSACEIGHMVIDYRGMLCTCGNRGCLETVAGGWGMEARARDAVNQDPIAARALLTLANGDPNGIRGAMIHLAAKKKDKLALSIINDAKEALIAGTASLVNILNPSVVLFGGGVIDANPELVGVIEEGVKKRALKSAIKNLKVKQSKLGGQAGAIGAAALVFRS